jgi:Transposase DDE domain/SWIM zinc finger
MTTATVQPVPTPEAARQERGRLLAQRLRITRKAEGIYIVPCSQPATSGNKPAFYTVETRADGDKCTCPDHELRAIRCKHSWAVEYSRRSETMADGSEKVVETLKVTYRQNWPAYNEAQTREGEHFPELLRDLCAGLTEEPQTGRGERRLPIQDRVMAVAMKVRSGLSTRRNDTEMRDLAARGFLSKAPHFNTVIHYMDDPALEPVLTALIERSAEPLASVETTFAPDSSGFSTCTFERWFDHKYGREHSKQLWIKAHVMVGVNTQIVTAVKITDLGGSDMPELPGLLAKTTERFDVHEVLADKGYLSHENQGAIAATGAVPYIPFKSNSVAQSKRHNGASAELWRKLFHYFQFQRSDFCRRYNQRSNAETAFSMVKRLFGASLRCKTTQGQRNELLAKFLCHNISVLIHEMYELGVAPIFWNDEPAARGLPANDDAQRILSLPNGSAGK